jgi:hypothetical protein
MDETISEGSSKKMSRFPGGEKGKPDLLRRAWLGINPRNKAFRTAWDQQEDSKFRRHPSAKPTLSPR